MEYYSHGARRARGEMIVLDAFAAVEWLLQTNRGVSIRGCGKCSVFLLNLDSILPIKLGAQVNVSLREGRTPSAVLVCSQRSLSDVPWISELESLGFPVRREVGSTVSREWLGPRLPKVIIVVAPPHDPYDGLR